MNYEYQTQTKYPNEYNETNTVSKNMINFSNEYKITNFETNIPSININKQCWTPKPYTSSNGIPFETIGTTLIPQNSNLSRLNIPSIPDYYPTINSPQSIRTTDQTSFSNFNNDNTETLKIDNQFSYKSDLYQPYETNLKDLYQKYLPERYPCVNIHYPTSTHAFKIPSENTNLNINTTFHIANFGENPINNDLISNSPRNPSFNQEYFDNCIPQSPNQLPNTSNTTNIHPIPSTNQLKPTSININLDRIPSPNRIPPTTNTINNRRPNPSPNRIPPTSNITNNHRPNPSPNRIPLTSNPPINNRRPSPSPNRIQNNTSLEKNILDCKIPTIITENKPPRKHIEIPNSEGITQSNKTFTININQESSSNIILSPSMNEPIMPKINSRGINIISKGLVMNISRIYDPKNPENPYNKLMKRLKNAEEKFIDPEFPPTIFSLTGGLTETKLIEEYGDCGSSWKSFIWLRPEEFFNTKNYKIFSDGIHPNDIKQGILGNCYFLSTVASLAEWPKRIERLIISHNINDYGCYAVKVCDMGEWKEIIIDDYFPCYPTNKTLVFSRSVGNELWVLLLEKAWAKLYGAYTNIDSGLPREALHDLTGAPTKYYNTEGITNEEKEMIWKEIEKGEKMNFVMTCGAGDFINAMEELKRIGLVASHAYSLLAALEIDTPYGKKRLVQLRNPWGKTEWNGDWGDQSYLWTSELKRNLKVENCDEGIFYMNYDNDFLRYFSDIQICSYYDDYIYSNLKARSIPRRGIYFKITIEKSGLYYITVNQKSRRYLFNPEDFRYSTVWFILGKIEGKNIIYIDGAYKADREVWIQSHLNIGEYIGYVKIKWYDKTEHDFVLSGYGPGETKINQINKDQIPMFVEKAYLNRAKKSSNLQSYSNFNQFNCFRAVELTKDGYGFIYYKNNSTKILNEDIYFTILEGLKLCKPYRGNSYNIRVAPSEEKIVLLKANPEVSIIKHLFSESCRFE